MVHAPAGDADWPAEEINSASPPVLSAFRPHPDRAAAISEAHARPSMPIDTPSVVYSLAFGTADETAVDAIHVAAFGEAQDGFARHVMRVVGPLTIKFERHTEFVALTVLSGEGADAGEAPLRRLRAMRPEGLTLLVALRAFVVEKPAPPYSPLDIGGCLRGEIEVSSSFRPNGDGYIDVQFAVGDVGRAQLGRRVQRVLEAETYRTMALIGLPMARRISAELSMLEGELAEITTALTEGTGHDQAILDKIQTLSAKTEAMRARTRYRFSASRAYATLVEERLDSLGEAKMGERSTLTGFLRTRLAPAVRTIVSSEQRQSELSASVERALSLLRARVDVSLDRGNQEILSSMNERQYRQLILSEAVESLSVIAISYYLLGILRYPAKALIDLGIIPVSETIALGLMAPFVAVGVFAILRLLRRRWLPDNTD
ncbi:DUF3422 domain-containing protein [Acuticoccus sp. MNP-M23]|uniref:DUF3422 domain-containing protein n=1 Tax=Acuticoccus sp. MNP-M23 TaxID=3072793 RepID=UPI0028168ADD|nr:DUF3422 domain-containing protein [Acuticoccus sp. MNP-M23]WMS44752.1 DUF3422 domain-containing protein [Acuticoccus sp. MNP-M23]